MATAPRKTTTRKTTTKRATTAKSTSAKSTTTKSAAPKSAAKAPAKTTAAKSSAKAAPPAATAAAKRSAPVKSTLAKAATAKTTAPKPAAKAATIVEDKPVVAGPALRKNDFIDAVVTRTGMKKKDVKPAVEAAMALLGEAIEEGREVNFPELGKVKVNREKELSSAKVIICKLRRNKKVAPVAPGPLAKAAE